MTTLSPEILQWLGCATGAAGSLLLAARIEKSGWGWVLFFISNVFWVLYALLTNVPGLYTQQTIFFLTSIIGIYRWLFADKKTSI